MQAGSTNMPGHLPVNLSSHIDGQCIMQSPCMCLQDTRLALGQRRAQAQPSTTTKPRQPKQAAGGRENLDPSKVEAATPLSLDSLQSLPNPAPDASEHALQPTQQEAPSITYAQQQGAMQQRCQGGHAELQQQPCGGLPYAYMGPRHTGNEGPTIQPASDIHAALKSYGAQAHWRASTMLIKSPTAFSNQADGSIDQPKSSMTDLQPSKAHPSGAGKHMQTVATSMPEGLPTGQPLSLALATSEAGADLLSPPTPSQVQRGKLFSTVDVWMTSHSAFPSMYQSLPSEPATKVTQVRLTCQQAPH